MDLTTDWNCPSIDMRAVAADQRCDICRQRSSNRMFALDEPLSSSTSPPDRQTWLLCEGCATAVVTEVERSALHTPLRVPIAVGLIAADRRPVPRLTILDMDFWERLPVRQIDSFVIGFVLCMFALPPLLFLLMAVLLVPGGAGQ